MPRTRWMALALGVAIALATTADFAPAQAQPRTKAAKKADPKATADPDNPDAAMPKGNDPQGSGDRGRGANPGARAEGSELDRLRELLVRRQASPYSTLLGVPAIQKEMKLTDKQKTTIRARIDGYGAQQAQLRREAREARQTGELSPEEAQATLDEFQQQYEANLAGILKADQKRRLNQISLQIQGPLALANPALAEKLNLSEELTAQIQEIVLGQFAARDQARELRRNAERGNRDPEADDAVAADLRESRARTSDRQAGDVTNLATQQIGKLLNTKQKSAFNKLLGEPFDLEQLEGGGRGRPGRRGGPPSATQGDDAAPKKGGPAMKDSAETTAEPAEGDAAPKAKADRTRGPARKAARPPADESE